jgi:glycerol-3-phosphate dehydrogenase (NAD(P)+)
MSISVLGAGAFGTALAISLAKSGAPVTLWARDPEQARNMQKERENTKRLAGHPLPDPLVVTSDISAATRATTLLLATPMQQLAGFADTHSEYLQNRSLVTCCKGIDLKTLQGPARTLETRFPKATIAVLTGPGFAADIAQGLPTALTLACKSASSGEMLQSLLSTDNLRLYRTTDTTGAELGGALKNIIAIASGAAIGAGLGESARAALMTRGFAEMQRLAVALDARAETLFGLSGFGDLTLTCTSAQSRNYRYGVSLGAEKGFDPSITVEGASTARAVSALAKTLGIDMPITTAITRVLDGKSALLDEIYALLSRPLKKE